MKTVANAEAFKKDLQKQLGLNKEVVVKISLIKSNLLEYEFIGKDDADKNSNEGAVIEALTLTYDIDSSGTKRYYNKEGQLHRIHGPAIITKGGSKYWYKNGLTHREDGPAVMYYDGKEHYSINDVELTKNQFVQWQKDNGIKPIE